MLAEKWWDEYNLRRPHESLANLTANEWKMKQLKNEIDNSLFVAETNRFFRV